MWAFHRSALTLAAACVAGAGLASEPAETGSGRVLLQPPARVVPSPITDRFAMTARYFGPKMSTFFRYDNPDDPDIRGTPFYLEDTLGLKDQMHQGWIDMMFRIGERHRIHAQYAQQSRRAVKELDVADPLIFGTSVFFDGDVLHSEMHQRKFDLIYTYSVLRRSRVEIGLGLGLHLLQFSGTVEEPATFTYELLDTAGPAASVAGDFTWRITDRFSLNGQGQWLQGRVAEVDGKYFAYRANLQYRAARNLSFGIGYGGTHYEVDSADPEFFSGYFWLHDHGPEAFVRVSF